MNPETILWSRVVLRAIWDLSGTKLKLPKKEAPTVQRITRAWFSSFNDSPGSFIWICNVLSSILTPFDNAYVPNQLQNYAP